MDFAAEAYAEGISNHAAGSEIEVLVDTLDATITHLDAYQASIAAAEPDEALDVVRLVERWTELRSELAEHPENGDLAFGEDEDEDDDPDEDTMTADLLEMSIGATLSYDAYPQDEIVREAEFHWVVWHDGESFGFDNTDALIEFLTN